MANASNVGVLIETLATAIAGATLPLTFTASWSWTSETDLREMSADPIVQVAPVGFEAAIADGTRAYPATTHTLAVSIAAKVAAATKNADIDALADFTEALETWLVNNPLQGNYGLVELSGQAEFFNPDDVDDLLAFRAVIAADYRRVIFT